MMTDADIYQYQKKGEYPSHSRAIAALVLLFGGFIVAGSYSLMNFWSANSGYILDLLDDIGVPAWITENVIVIVVALGSLLIMSLLMAIAASAVAKRMGATLIYIGAFFMNVMTWLIVLVVFAASGFNLAVLMASWPIMIPGFFTLFITLLLFTVFRSRLKRAGEIIKLTGQVCLDERGVFVPPLFTMIFGLVAAVMFGAIILQFPDVLNALTGYSEWTLETAVPFGLGVVVYLFTTIFFYNFAYSTSSAITYIYMRGRDPTLGDGVKASLGVVTGLAALAAMSVIVVIVRMLLQRLGRQVGGAGGEAVGRAAGGIIGWIWALINYFTIPAMVAEGLGAKKGIKRSIGLVRKNFVDVMIKETAVRWAFGVLAAMFFIAFAVGGALIGWYWADMAGYDIITGIVLVAIVFTIFASIPSALVLRTFDIVYVTLLYVFIRQQEGDITGKTAIPGDLEDELQAAYRSAKKSGN